MTQAVRRGTLLSVDRGFAVSGVFDVREEVRLTALGKIFDPRLFFTTLLQAH